MKEIEDIMTKSALIQEMEDPEFHRSDIMTKNAMEQRGAEFCPNCSNPWDMHECKECGFHR